MISHLTLLISETIGGQDLVRNKNVQEFHSCSLPPAFLPLTRFLVMTWVWVDDISRMSSLDEKLLF